MAQASDIIAQLQNTLPRVTDLFSDTFSITSLTRSGSIVTAVTSAPHNFNTGDFVNIVGAQVPVRVTSLTRNGNVVTGITASPHDLTDGYQQTIKIVGADQPEYNGDALPFIHQENRDTFTYSISGTPTSPATGNIFLFDGKERGYNGRFEVTKIDAMTFTYEITGTPVDPIGTITAHGAVRVSGAINPQRATLAYTRQNSNKLWAFVIMGPSTASKDRNILNDGIYTFVPGQVFRLRIIKQFSVLVFCPATDQIGGRQARDLMEDVEVSLFKCLLRFVVPTTLADQTEFGIVYEKGELAAYNDAYSIFEFTFQITCDVTYPDTIDPDENVAFRDIGITFNNNPHEPVTLGVNLDDKPL